METGTFVSSRVSVRRLKKQLARQLGWAALGAWVLPVAAAVVAGVLTKVFDLDNLLMPGVALGWLASWFGFVPALSIGALIASARYRNPYTTIEADRGELRLHRRGSIDVVPRGELTGALELTGRKGESIVEITTASGDSLLVELADSEEAGALVKALELGAAQRRAVIALGGATDPLASGCGGVVLGAVATLFATCGGYGLAGEMHLGNRVEQWIPYVLGALFVAVSLLVAKRNTPRRMVIGADGVVVQGAFRDRFYPRAQIELVEQMGPHLVLVVREGDRIRRVNLTSEAGDRRAALRQRIQDALRQPGGEESAERAARLGRGGESIAAWRDRVRKIVGAGGDYRAVAIPADALVRTAKSLEVPADVRLGAAMAIAFGEDESAKRELRVSTEAIANAKLRVALERAADGDADEEAIAEALAEDERLREAAS